MGVHPRRHTGRVVRVPGDARDGQHARPHASPHGAVSRGTALHAPAEDVSAADDEDV